MERPDYVKNFDRPKNTEIKYINGSWYLYERFSEWDKVNKRNRKRSGKIIGKVTPDGLVPSKRRNKKPAAQTEEPSALQEVAQEQPVQEPSAEAEPRMDLELSDAQKAPMGQKSSQEQGPCMAQDFSLKQAADAAQTPDEAQEPSMVQDPNADQKQDCSLGKKAVGSHQDALVQEEPLMQVSKAAGHSKPRKRPKPKSKKQTADTATQNAEAVAIVPPEPAADRAHILENNHDDDGNAAARKSAAPEWKGFPDPVSLLGVNGTFAFQGITYPGFETCLQGGDCTYTYTGTPWMSDDVNAMRREYQRAAGEEDAWSGDSTMTWGSGEVYEVFNYDMDVLFFATASDTQQKSCPMDEVLAEENDRVSVHKVEQSASWADAWQPPEIEPAQMSQCVNARAESALQPNAAAKPVPYNVLANPSLIQLPKTVLMTCMLSTVLTPARWWDRQPKPNVQWDKNFTDLLEKRVKAYPGGYLGPVPKTDTTTLPYAAQAMPKALLRWSGAVKSWAAAGLSRVGKARALSALAHGPSPPNPHRLPRPPT